MSDPTIQDLLDAQRKTLEVEFENKALNEQIKKAKQGAEEHAKRRSAAVEQLLFSVGELIHEVRLSNSLLVKLVTQYPISDAIQELTVEIHRGQKNTNDTLELLLEINRLALVYLTTSDKVAKKQVTDLLRRTDKITLHKRLEIYHANLSLLLEHEAKLGGKPDLELANSIADQRSQIEDLEMQIDGLN